MYAGSVEIQKSECGITPSQHRNKRNTNRIIHRFRRKTTPLLFICTNVNQNAPSKATNFAYASNLFEGLIYDKGARDDALCIPLAMSGRCNIPIREGGAERTKDVERLISQTDHTFIRIP